MHCPALSWLLHGCVSSLCFTPIKISNHFKLLHSNFILIKSREKNPITIERIHESAINMKLQRIRENPFACDWNVCINIFIMISVEIFIWMRLGFCATIDSSLGSSNGMLIWLLIFIVSHKSYNSTDNTTLTNYISIGYLTDIHLFRGIVIVLLVKKRIAASETNR